MENKVSNHHVPVLLNEVLSFVEKDISKDFTFIDMTLGRGGHSSKIIEKLNNKRLNYYGIDRDDEAIIYVKEKFKNYKGNINIIKSEFSTAIDKIENLNVKGADLILFDIGVSSPQFDNPARGFSYRENSTLDMRMDQSQKLDAKIVVNTYSEKELADLIYHFGDEIYSRQIAKNIVKYREEKGIETTFELVEIIKNSLPKKELFKEHHPAKKTFMALRYEVNKELDELTIGLEKAIKFLNKGGKVLVITFNSTEDKIVKDLFRKYSQHQFISKYLPQDENDIDYINLTKKPIEATSQELEINLRSKPAKLRGLQRKEN